MFIALPTLVNQQQCDMANANVSDEALNSTLAAEAAAAAEEERALKAEAFFWYAIQCCPEISQQ